MRNDNQAHRKGLKGSIDGCWNKLIHGRDSSENTLVSVGGSDSEQFSRDCVTERCKKKKKKRRNTVVSGRMMMLEGDPT